MSDCLGIGFVTGSVSRLAGGLFHSVRRLAHSLEASGANLTVFAPSDAHSQDDAMAWNPLRLNVFPRRGPAALGYGHGLKQHLIEADLEVTHVHGLWQHPSIAVSSWRKRTGRPVMISPRGMLDPWALSHSGWKKRLAGAVFENENLRAATCLHALNESEAVAMRGYGLANPIAIIPNGTDLPDLCQRPARPSWLPDDGRKTLLFLGRLHKKKGLIELVEAWSIIRQTAPQIVSGWRLVIAGWDDGGHLQEVQRAIAKAGLKAEEVLLPGPLHGEAKDAALAAANAFILPSKSEGLPMAILEAWSWALPVLMTDACNLPEGFANGAAFKIPQNVQEFAAVLNGSLAREDLTDVGKAGRRLVENHFAWPAIAGEHLAVYRWMLGQCTTPSCVRLLGV